MTAAEAEILDTDGAAILAAAGVGATPRSQTAAADGGVPALGAPRAPAP